MHFKYPVIGLSLLLACSHGSSSTAPFPNPGDLCTGRPDDAPPRPLHSDAPAVVLPLDVSAAVPSPRGTFGLVAQGAAGDFVLGVSSRAGDFLVRYHVDGARDASFGDGGVVALGNGRTDRVWTFDVLVDGRILAIGSRGEAAGGAGARTIRRLDKNGHLDPTYAKAGLAILSYGSTSLVTEPSWVATTDGKIVMSDYVDDPVPTNVREIVSRVDANGAFDATFGTAGKVEVALNIAMTGVMPDGTIVVAAGEIDPIVTAGGFPAKRVSVQRLSPTGVPAGPQRALVGLESPATLLPSGKLLAFAQEPVTDDDIASPTCALLARLGTDGALDATFGVAGRAVGTCASFWTQHQSGARNGLARAPDGSMVVAGASGEQRGGILRLTACGVPDTSFGTNGIASIVLDASFRPVNATDAEDGNTTTLTDITLLPDGHLIAAGYTSLTGCSDCGIIPKIFVVRLDAAGNADAQFPAR